MAPLPPRVLASDTVTCARLGEESVLLNTETGLYFGLDAVGTTVWEALERGATPDEIVAHITEQYDVVAERAQADVAAFFDELTTNGLARLASEPR